MVWKVCVYVIYVVIFHSCREWRTWQMSKIACAPAVRLLHYLKVSQNPHHPLVNPTMWISTSVSNLTPRTIQWVMFHLQANFALWEFIAIMLCRQNALFSVTKWVIPGKRRVSWCIVFFAGPYKLRFATAGRGRSIPLWTLFSSKSLP